MINSWWAGERTGKPFALVVKIFVGNITARTGSPNHRFWACSLGTSADNSKYQSNNTWLSMNDPHLKQDKLFHDNRVIYRFYSTKAMAVILLHHHYYRNYQVHVLEKQTNTRQKKKRFSMETGKEYSYSKI